MQYFFDKKIDNEVHASIFYWIGINLPFLIFTVNEIIRRRERSLLIFYVGACIYFIYDIIYQISLRNLTLKEYEDAVYAMTPSYDFIKYVVIVVILNLALFEHKKVKKLIHKIHWNKWRRYIK